MSFKDELRTSIRPLEEIKKEVEDKTIVEIKNNVKHEINSLKEALKKNASNGDYLDFGNYKLVTAEVPTQFRKYCEITSTMGKERRGFFGGDIHIYYTVTCNLSSNKYTNVYLDEIKRVSNEEDIECSIVAVYTDMSSLKNIKYRWNVPGSKKIDSFGVYPYQVKLYLRASVRV